MVGAKINGMIVPIDRIPQNGEIVEILTSPTSRGPSRDWLKIVKTGEARTKIRQWFKKEKRAENIIVGRSEIEKELRKYNRPYTEAQKNEILANTAARVGVNSVEDLYNTIGYGGLTMSKLSGKLREEFDRVIKPEPDADVLDVSDVQTTVIPKHRKSVSCVLVDGVEGCSVKFARCCSPVPGDKLIGFITKGYGISIHKRDCPNVGLNHGNPLYSERWVAASWNLPESAGENLFEALLQIRAENRITLISDITMVLADMKVSILQINTQKKSNNEIILSMVISCKNVDHMKSIISRLRVIKSVESVERGYS